jgi:dihydrolipoamide dehydrogenase
MFGVRATLEGVDLPAVNTYRDGIVASKHKGFQGLIKARGITTIEGTGPWCPPPRWPSVRTPWSVRTSILATGSYPKSLPGLDIGGRIITSEQALQLDWIPNKVIVLGGGVIGVEFASVWRSFGSEVTIIEGLPHLVPAEDESISKQFERAYRKRGINFHTGVRFQSATQDDASVTVTLEDGTTETADLLLVAVGRGPKTEGMGFEEVGVAMDRGYVLTDERLRTNVPGVFAVGDIVPGIQLAHRGFQHGIFVAEELAGLNPMVVVDRNIPKVTYSEPEVASVGYSETAAKEEFGDAASRSMTTTLRVTARATFWKPRDRSRSSARSMDQFLECT